MNNDKYTDYDMDEDVIAKDTVSDDDVAEDVDFEDEAPTAEIAEDEVSDGELSDGENALPQADVEDDGELDWQPTGIQYSELKYNEEVQKSVIGEADEEIENAESAPDELGGEVEDTIPADDTIYEATDTYIDTPLPSDEEEYSDDDEEEYPDDEPTDEKPAKQARERVVGSRGVDTLFDFLELFIFTFVAVLIATSFLFRHSVVSGPSMMNTLQNEDKLIISDFLWEPRYMDIVVVQDYSAGIDDPIVKRVIATEGETVRVTPDGIYVNGEFLNESDYVYVDSPYKYYYDVDWSAFSDNETLKFVHGEYYEFTVPENEIFILGDHRNNSKDSRYYGTVREDSVLGRVIVRFYPFNSFTFFERKGADDGN